LRRIAGLIAAGAVVASLLAFIAHWTWRNAAAQETGWINETVNGMHYAVLLPQNFDPATRYPVVLYLHQLAMGTYREGLLHEIDPWFKAAAFRVGHPAIVVVPMLDQSSDPGGVTINFGGKREGHVGQENTLAALQQVMAKYPVDAARIYVTGNSMGGIGTWDMLLSYNARTGQKGRIFAAGMPLAGAHRTADPAAAAEVLQTVPIWSIHGAKDKEVSLDWDRAMSRLLSGRPTFRYTEDPGLGHDVWDSYYRQSRVWDWLFSQRAPDGQRVPASRPAPAG
jgi:predicted peptidase